MHIIDHISKLPSDAVLAVFQQDGSVHVYMPGDVMPEEFSAEQTNGTQE